MPADEFMQHILSEQLNVKLLLVGHDHHFGHNREAGVDDYRAYGMKCGIEVVQAARYSTPGFEKISSSTIRASLLQGEIETANALLTYPYNFTGLVSNGFKVGRTIGFPTANLVPVEPDKLIPGNGVYAVTATWNGQNYKAMMNIGTRPTFEKGDQTSIEVHIIDFHENIYHKKLEISFIRKIRNEQKFASVEDLITQLQADKEIVVNMPW